MTVETQLKQVKEVKRKRSRVSQTHDEIFPFEAEQGSNLIEPMKDFYNRAEADKLDTYEGFEILRDPVYMLWFIQKDGKSVYRLDGRYTTIAIARQSIDEFLNQVVDTPAPVIVKKAKNKKNDTAKSNHTQN